MNTKLEGTVLVTGASGFIGSRLCKQLEQGGSEVVTLRRKASPPPKTGRSVEADYDDLPGLRRAVEEVRPSTILHVAGVTKGVTYGDFRKGNVMPTENLLSAARGLGGDLRRFVLVSSLAAYGPAGARPVEEGDAKRPVEHYGRSKMEAESVVEVDRSVPWTIMRPSGVYGPGDVDYFELYKSAAKGVNAYFGNRHKRMSIVYVDDCVDAILAAAASPEALHQGYFICDGAPCTWGDYQSHVVRRAGRRVIDLHLPGALTTLAGHAGELATRLDGKPRLFNRQKAIMGAQEAWTCSGEKLASEVGFRARVGLAEGVERTFDWYRREGWI